MGPIARRPDWPERLALALARVRREPFAWGACDCCLWTADVVRDLTGVDFAGAWRGRYADAAGAYRRLARSGGLARVVTDCLGEPMAPRLARRGDVVLTEFDGFPALGVATDRGAAFKARRGVTYLPLAACRLAWRVGRG